ncbi:hypothetical protein SAMN05444266_10589 [Chitinophaga jiangningensis]|uniref:Outer membrane lipoprotein-sorting protein n=1 Tax=Chitinophaga jiangningensis TaxID=1419482 RepID=A0A1M7DQ44_9BACT|nr:hypothetical protein [Chitinophaga jiangningensis]SHL81634.1 hypothetical protein SAMN05444266_10589 [Chitinophaga jiangningensis]
MFKKIRLIFLVPILLLMAAAIAFAARRPWYSLTVRDTVKSDQPAFSYNPKEKQVLKQLTTLFKRALASDRMIISGNINYTDPADSASSGSLPFYYCRRNNECYYAADGTEMIALKDVYILIDHPGKQIIVSGPKKIEVPTGFPDYAIVGSWEKDNYLFHMDTLAQGTRVRLECSNHVYCKLYEYQADFSTGIITAIKMRLTDLDRPLDTLTDKIYECSIKEWTYDQADNQLFKKNKYLTGTKNNYRPSPEYENYQLIDKN